MAESTVKRLAQDIEHQAGSQRVPGKTNGPMRAAGDGAYRNKRDVWTVATAAFGGPHFATFPPELIRPCILAGSAPGNTVLDPFFGAGTTGLVAWQEGREYIGIELHPDNCDLARRRIEAAVWQMRLEAR